METYSNKKAAELLTLSGKLLKAVKPVRLADVSDTLHALYEVIPYHDWCYYKKNNPVITDFEYDQLYSLLKQLEKAHPEMARPGSPVEHVAPDLENQFPVVHHKVPMLSLDNTYHAAVLQEWMQKTGKRAYCAEPKFDGTGISLLYEHDRLVRGATRGDGASGEDITAAIRQVAGIPETAPWSRYGIAVVELRGEVLMSKKSFRAYNEERARKGLPLMANPRNAAAGTLRLLHPQSWEQHRLEAVLYQVSFYAMEKGVVPPESLLEQGKILDLLTTLGFPAPSRQKLVSHSFADVIRYCRDFEAKRDSFPYETDGIVVKVNNSQDQRSLGMTSHHPRWALAYKFKPRQATSKLREVVFSVGRMGAVTPVAKIDPVPIGGVTVASVSLFNEKQVQFKDIRIGDTVLVERAGDVIPYIVKPVKEERTGREKKIRFPVNCPVCGHPLQRPFGESIWYCVNMGCQAQVIARMVHFAGKDAMDITGLGEQHMRELFDHGLITDIPSLFDINYDRLASLQRWGKRSAGNLRAAVEKARRQPLYRLIYGLGIHYVGIATAKTLVDNINRLTDLVGVKAAVLMSWKDIGPTVAESICQFFNNKANVKMLQKLAHLNVNMQTGKRRPAAKHTLDGKTFLFTGTLSGMTRKVAAAMVEEHGGKVLNSVSRGLNYLVAGSHPGHKLAQSRANKTVKVLTEHDFLEMVES
ncbi:NAD-dependent DNA ligase LigA [Chitinophaga qingshengii]|uniref:DNA ligase n=1 Tax=Chitinophaga qingshengii TaxID=1569794 RepID=A0ABR7TV56_9BACT|nr:NAD-dependent DNA ligase LigA [Chitinophaga qingshengii]MBC9932844.1 NAD-dependent DNA ligase LigA [Chitinophaga qingshengii]